MVTYRRHWLDTFLAATAFDGRTLDVGGEREGARGRFRPKAGSDWTFLNPDSSTNPDVVAMADQIPFPDGSFQNVKLTEVLEHLETPESALRECGRVLAPGGKLVVSVPFLVPVHGDPHDFRRWTPSGLKQLLERAGFSRVEIRPMGGCVAVVLDLFEYYCHHQVSARGKLRWWVRVIRIFLRRVLPGFLLWLDGRLVARTEITTGYFLEARK